CAERAGRWLSPRTGGRRTSQRAGGRPCSSWRWALEYFSRRLVFGTPVRVVERDGVQRSIPDWRRPRGWLCCPLGNQPVEAPEVVFNREHLDLLEARVHRVGTER